MKSMKSVLLKDGRRMVYKEVGDLFGLPVLFFHGNLNSREFAPCWNVTQDETAACNVRLIQVDRPGYGGSDFPATDELRTYSNFARDVGEFVEHLGLTKLCVAGFSSGGPHALACASKEAPPSLLERLLAVTLISSDAPYKELNPEVVQRIYGLSPPITIEMAMKATEMNVENMRDAYSLMTKRERKEIALRDLETALQQGIRGPAFDMILETGDWGFEIGEIEKPVRLWHGKADSDVPFLAAEFLHGKLKKNDRFKFFAIEGESHTLIRRKWKEILEDLHQTSSLSGSSL